MQTNCWLVAFLIAGLLVAPLLAGPAASPVAGSPLGAMDAPTELDGRAAAGAPETPLGMIIQPELEPNDSYQFANLLIGPVSLMAVISGTLPGTSDADWYKFDANEGERVYAMTMTSANHASTNVATKLELFRSDGTTLIEMDDSDGSFGVNASSIAGTVITQTATYYLKLTTSVDQPIVPYRLHVHTILEDPIITEEEPNDSALEAQTLQGLPALITGTLTGTLAQGSVDWYRFYMGPGDTVFLSLDQNPERDDSDLLPYLGIASPPFGTDLHRVNDGGTAGSPYSTAIVYTSSQGGFHYAYIASPNQIPNNGNGYHLSITIQQLTTAFCYEYLANDIPLDIPNPGTVTSTLTVGDNINIFDVDVRLWITHTRTADLTVRLRSPAGTEQNLFSVIGEEGDHFINTWIDQQAALPISALFYDDPSLAPFTGAWMPEPPGGMGDDGGDMGEFDGEDSPGDWQLVVTDGPDNDDEGVLYLWGLHLCGVPNGEGTSTPSPTPTATDTATAAPTTVETETPTNTPAASATPTASATATFTASPGPSPTATDTPTPGPSPTASQTATASPSPTATQTPTSGPSPTATSTPTPGPSATATQTATSGPSPTATHTPTAGASSTATNTPTAGPSPTATNTSTPGPSPTAIESATPGPSPSPSPTATDLPTGVQVQRVEARSAPGAWDAGAPLLLGAAAVAVGALVKRRRSRHQ